MRILLISQIFLPEMGALANRLYPIARALVAAGHDVCVATGMPNYPEGKVFPEYQGKRTMAEDIEGVHVLRTAYFTAPRNISKWKQLRSYLSFVPAVFRSGLRAGKVDIVFVTSPPIFPAVAAIFLAQRSRAKLVFDIRDLWPDELVACGASREGSMAVRLVRAIERWIYRRADCVACTTEAFIDTVTSRGVPREKTILAPNGADLQLFQPLDGNNPIAAEYPFGDRHVVMYSGLLGIKHDLETLLEAAELLRNEKQIVFFIRGNGPRAAALRQHAQEHGLDNVLFGGERPMADLPYLIARSDVCVTSLLPDPYMDKIISVKIFEYLACEKPVVAALGGEGARVLTESGGGVVVPASDSRAMADAILTLCQDPALRQKMGRLGRAYVEANYSRETTAVRMERIFEGLVAPAKEPVAVPLAETVQ